MKLTQEEVRLKLEVYCAYQERAVSEVRSRCAILGVPHEWHNELLQHLQENNFLNEERFAESYASGKFRIKKWGKRKIYAGLKQKGVSAVNIQQALQTIDAEAYYQTLVSMAERKTEDLSSKKGTAWEQKIKLTRFLIQRGYESDLVGDVVNLLIKE